MSTNGRPNKPFECIEEAIDPELFKEYKQQKEKEIDQEQSVWQSLDKVDIKEFFPDINKDGEFPCMNFKCGYGASFGRTGSDYWDTWIKPGEGKIFIGRGAYSSSHSDYRPLFGDCPMCSGNGYIPWDQFKLEYDRIMSQYNKKMKVYNNTLDSVLTKLTKEEIEFIEG